MDEAQLIPLYDKGSLGSVADDFGIGLMMHLFHILGTILLLKQTLNNVCIYNTAESFFTTSACIASDPTAFIRFGLKLAFCYFQ